MGRKRTSNSDLPEGAIVIAIDVAGVNEKRAEAILQAMLDHVGQADYDLAMDHLYNRLVEDVLMNEESPLHQVFRQAMSRLSAHATEHLHHSHERIAALEEELRSLKAELAALRSRLQTLEVALGAVRRCLKSDRAKHAVQYCQRFRRRQPVGETEQAASELAEVVKDACVCIRQL